MLLSGELLLWFTYDMSGVTSSEGAFTNGGQLRISTRQLIRSFRS